MHRNAQRLLRLVNTLLDFSRIEAGRVEAVYEPTDLAALTADLVSSFRAATDRAGLSLIVDSAPLAEEAYVDRGMWEKIVLNLVSNAFKFTFEGSITVRVRLGEKAFELEVADTGTGIAPAETPRLFERFHRVEGARSRSHEGSGIGLALVEELVRFHGGAVAVDSEEGRGTTFVIRIPRGSAHLPAERIKAARRLPSTSTGAMAYVEEALRWTGDSPEPPWAPEPERDGAPRPRILFADDNADMRDYVARLLRERWDVTVVANGDDALARIRRSPPDLVVSDVMMPGLDGFGLVQAMRADPVLRAIPVILLSARAGEDAAAEGLGAGADDYIVKPFTARDLLVRVASKLSSARAAREANAIKERARDEAQELAAGLKAAVEARDRALQEAEQTSRAKDEFLATMSHELRTPLNAMMGWSKILRQSPRDERKLEHGLAVIERNAATQARLVSDLLDVSRIISGKLRLAVQRLELSAVVYAAVEVVRQAADARGVRLVLKLDPDLGVMLGDPDRVQQILWNLLINAVKFTPGGGTVTVTGQRHDSTLSLRVHDTGQGIPVEHLPHIFERFRQVDASTSRAHGGLGLGLAIVRHLAEAHGGSVSAESAGPGRGSTFTVTLPIRAEVQDGPAPDSEGARGRGSAALGAGESSPARQPHPGGRRRRGLARPLARGARERRGLLRGREQRERGPCGRRARALRHRHQRHRHAGCGRLHLHARSARSRCGCPRHCADRLRQGGRRRAGGARGLWSAYRQTCGPAGTGHRSRTHRFHTVRGLRRRLWRSRQLRGNRARAARARGKSERRLPWLRAVRLEPRSSFAHGTLSAVAPVMREHDARREASIERITEALRTLRQDMGHDVDATAARSPAPQEGEPGRRGEQR